MNGKRRKVRVHERAAPFRLHGGRRLGLIGMLLLTACQGDAGTAPDAQTGATFSAVVPMW